MITVSNLLTRIKNMFSRSCFIVIDNKEWWNNNKTIVQNIINVKTFILSMLESNKREFFTVQAINLFCSLDRKVKYESEIQSFTVYLLKKITNLGYITQLTIEKTDEKSPLSLERFSLNVKKSQKEYSIYNVSFVLTKKKLDDRAIKKFIRLFNIDMDKYRIKKKHGKFFLQPRLTKFISLKKEELSPKKVTIPVNNCNYNKLTQLSTKTITLIRTKIFKKEENKEIESTDIQNKKEVLLELRDQITSPDQEKVKQHILEK